MIISHMVMTPVENTLKKGQRNGDATRVVVSSEIGTLDGQVPTIDVEVKSHDVSLEGYRIIEGQKVKVNNINKKNREKQLAIIEEQKRNKQSFKEEIR